MPNLMQQMDILKNLSDGQLTQEMQAPSGGAAPFLVASEIARRKDMRQRYTADLAMARPKTTVAQDVMQGFAGGPPGGMPGDGNMPAGVPAGLPAAAPGGGSASPVQGYASGGLVDAADPTLYKPDYAALAQKYQSMLTSDATDRDRAAALGLLSAGAGILGGGHSNLVQNLGAGINAGIGTYSDRLKTLDSQDRNLMGDLVNLGSAQDTSQLNAARLDPNSPLNLPTSIREIQYINGMPDGPEKDAAMKIITPFAAQKAANSADDAATQAKMIHDGDLMPPTSLGMGGQGGAIQAAFGRLYPGESLAQLQLDAKAAQTYATHMNSNQIIKQQSNLSAADDQLTQLQSLADNWKAGQFPILNSAVFHTALQGGLGPKAQSLASQFQQQLADTKLTMQQVFAGGYAGTDKQLAQIDNMFNTAAPQKTFDDLINLARTNVKFRAKALTAPQAMGANGLGTNTFAPGPAPAPGGGTTSTNVPFTVEP